jgi:hypothetical protein
MKMRNSAGSDKAKRAGGVPMQLRRFAFLAGFGKLAAVRHINFIGCTR